VKQGDHHIESLVQPNVTDVSGCEGQSPGSLFFNQCLGPGMHFRTPIDTVKPFSASREAWMPVPEPSSKMDRAAG
jgi:hypothetical protein